ncbi:recombination-associated protein RdgC [Neptunomonas phycophila]|uniref:recombination-associated protein RdgC n=1 Tax=Neptunomonas phycophila TaxID=1572645 RepID=UPI003518F6C2
MIIPKRCVTVPTEEIDIPLLIEAIEKLKFKECLKDMEESWGFFPADEIDESSPLAISVDCFTLITVRHDRKTVNKTRLSRAWRKEVEAQEKASQMRFDKPRKDEVREAVKKRMLKEALPDESYYKAVINTRKKCIYVLVSVPSQAEFVIDKISKALISQSQKINFAADTLQEELEDTLTQWVATPNLAEDQGFTVGGSMMMKGEESSTAALKHHNPESAEVKEHLFAGKSVSKTALYSKDDNGNEISLVLAANKIMSQIDLKGICNAQVKAERENSTDVSAMREAEFLIWMNALSDLCEKVGAIEKI